MGGEVRVCTQGKLWRAEGRGSGAPPGLLSGGCGDAGGWAATWTGPRLLLWRSATAASLVCAAALPGLRGRRRCESRALCSKQAPTGCSIQGGLRVHANLLRKAIMSCEIIILHGAAVAPTALTPGLPSSGLCA